MVTLKPGFRRIQVFLYHDEPKSELARDLDDRGQSRNVPYGTSGICAINRWKNLVVNKKETEYNTFVKLCFVT